MIISFMHCMLHSGIGLVKTNTFNIRLLSKNRVEILKSDTNNNLLS